MLLTPPVPPQKTSTAAEVSKGWEKRLNRIAKEANDGTMISSFHLNVYLFVKRSVL